MDRYFKITNGIDTEVYDPHYSFQQAIESFRSIHDYNGCIDLYFISKEDYLDIILSNTDFCDLNYINLHYDDLYANKSKKEHLDELIEKRRKHLDEVIEKKRKEVKFI